MFGSAFSRLKSQLSRNFRGGGGLSKKIGGSLLEAG